MGQATTPSPSVEQAQERLTSARQTLAQTLTQVVKMGGTAHALSGQLHTIRETRVTIVHLKARLRGWGIEIVD